MAFVNSCSELDDLGGGQFRSIHHVKPAAYLLNGSYYRSNHDWVNGDETFSHVVTAAPMLIYTAADGMRRICPTREPTRYIEIGAPYVKVAGVWTKPSFGAATRSGNRITWHNPNADLSVTFGGHYIKMDIELLGGYVPSNRQFAFPVGMNGLTRNGGRILRDGVEVMHLRPPDLYDAAVPESVRLPIAYQFVTVGSQPYLLFTLPTGVSSMTRPVVDPTFEVQPAAAEGMDLFTYPTAPDETKGGDAELFCSNNLGGSTRNVILKMDLTAIPSGATLTSASLSFFVGATWAGAEDGSNTAVYQILSANSGWTEAGASHNHAVGTTDWSGGHTGCGTSGTDHDATADGNHTHSGNNPAVGTECSHSLDASRVQNLLADNYGWVVKNTVGGRGIWWASSDHATASYRPKLTVVYTEASSIIPLVRHHMAQQGMA